MIISPGYEASLSGFPVAPINFVVSNTTTPIPDLPGTSI